MVNDLAAPSDLTGFPGAPFTDAVVDAAVGSLRREARWHIAPEREETILVDGDGTRVLMLPTLHLTEVTEVRDVSGDSPVVLTGWRKSRAGMIYRHAGWPHGFEAIEVDIVHGYEETPAELFPVLADTAQRRVAQESLGSRSVSYAVASDVRMSDTLARFKIPNRP